MEEVDKLIQEMPRADNIYPTWVFPLTLEEAVSIVRKYSIDPDPIFAAWGRYVWDKAVEAQCKLLAEQGWIKGEK